MASAIALLWSVRYKVNIFIFVKDRWEMSSGQGDEDKNLVRLSQRRNGNSMHMQCNGTHNDNKTSFPLLIHVSFVWPTTGVSFHASENII